MNRKQFVASAFAASIPACLLIASMVWALFEGGMLGDDAKVSAALWVVFVIAALGGIVIAVLPFAILIFPGLYPQSGRAGQVRAPDFEDDGAASPKAVASPADDSADDFGGSESFEDYADEPGAEFDEFDEFSEEAEEEAPQPKKKRGR